MALLPQIPAIVSDRRAWALLAASGIALELVALWFQHGMGLDPCVMCVYQRLAVFGIVAAGAVGLLAPGVRWIRFSAYGIWLVSAAWGLQLALEHAAMQRDPQLAFSCDFAANFPAWAKLDEWLPALFLPTGYCDDVQWQWFSLTMVEWMVVVFAIYLFILVAVIAADARGLLRRNRA
jgi:disulfide bond formation protein DsbB